MTPNDYYKAAEKHLSCCLNWRDKTEGDKSKDYELLETYYLLGYVAECFTVYTVYRFGHWNPRGITSGNPKSRTKMSVKEDDVESFFDPVFTYYTGYDYFNKDKEATRDSYRKIERVTSDGKKGSDEYLEEVSGADEYKYIVWTKIANGRKFVKINRDASLSYAIDGGKISLKDACKYHTQGHKFQKVIENSICAKLCNEEGLKSNVTFFENYKNSKDVAFKLLKEWSTKIRYCSSIQQWEDLDKKRHSSGIITRENLVLLMDVLEKLHEELDKNYKP